MTTPYGQEPVEGQPQYGQPPAQYSQGQPVHPRFDQRSSEQPYGPPAAPYGAVANAYGEPVGSGAKFGVVGSTMAGIGAVLLIVAFVGVNWTDTDGTSFSKLSDYSDNARVPSLTSAYFGWLGWALLIVSLVVAIVANLPTPAAGPLRALGGVLGVLGIVLTMFALKANDSFGDVFKHASGGFYLALVGFLLIGIGALVGPKRRF